MISRVILILFSIISLKTSACCSAGQFRIFPMGLISGKPLCAVFEMSRVCTDDGNMGSDNETSWFGIMSLQFLEKDSLRLLKAIDTFEILECVCGYKDISEKSEYRVKMQKYLDKAFNLAEKEKGFQIFQAVDYAADSSSISKLFSSLNDTSVIWKDKIIPLDKHESISCYTMNEIKEVRTYSIKNYNLIVVTVSCPTKSTVTDEQKKINSELFKKSAVSMTYIPVDWHGYSIDLIEYSIKKK